MLPSQFHSHWKHGLKIETRTSHVTHATSSHVLQTLLGFQSRNYPTFTLIHPTLTCSHPTLTLILTIQSSEALLAYTTIIANGNVNALAIILTWIPLTTERLSQGLIAILSAPALLAQAFKRSMTTAVGTVGAGFALGAVWASPSNFTTGKFKIYKIKNDVSQINSVF